MHPRRPRSSYSGARDFRGRKFIVRTGEPLGNYSYRTTVREAFEFPAFDWPEIFLVNPVQAWIFFFRLSFRNCLSCVLTARIFLLSNLSSAVQYMMFHIFIFINSSFTGKLRTHNMSSSHYWFDSSVGRALHRHRRGHGFESRSSLNFFQAFFSQPLNLRTNCEDLSSI